MPGKGECRMYCRFCGKELAEGSAFCNHCGRSQNEAAVPAAPAVPAPDTAGRGTLKCPNCGSARLQFVTHTKTQGVSIGDSCCGYILLGPLGLLCGLCGAGSSETKEGWVCLDCGHRFTTRDVEKAAQKKLEEQQALANEQEAKAREKRSREINLAYWRSVMVNCPYPAEQLEALYADATKQEEEAEKRFRDARQEEQKNNGVWQAANYGMVAGGILLLIAALWTVIAFMGGGAWVAGLLLGVAAFFVIGVFADKDEKLYEQYASEALRALKQEKEQATQHKAELQKYLEAYHGLQNEDQAGAPKAD